MSVLKYRAEQDIAATKEYRSVIASNGRTLASWLAIGSFAFAAFYIKPLLEGKDVGYNNLVPVVLWCCAGCLSFLALLSASFYAYYASSRLDQRSAIYYLIMSFDDYAVRTTPSREEIDKFYSEQGDKLKPFEQPIKEEANCYKIMVISFALSVGTFAAGLLLAILAARSSIS